MSRRTWQQFWSKWQTYQQRLRLTAIAFLSALLVVFDLLGGIELIGDWWSKLFPPPQLSLEITPKDQIIQLGDTINLSYVAADYGYLSLWQQALQGAVTQILPQTQGSTLKLDASLKSRTLFNLKAEGKPDRISFILLWTADQPEHLSYRVYPDKAAFAAAVQA